jgi:hypothetical protein
VRHKVRLVAQVCVAFGICGACAGIACAQVAPSAAAQSADTPTIKVGATLFTDFTYIASPDAVDVDGNRYHPSQFNLTRSYINITGTLSHLVAFRITPDIVRDTTAGSATSGSLLLRVKYGFAQVNLDDWLPPQSWVRLGVQPTPWVEFEEGIYRYRFQGTTFAEREGFLSSSDAGLSFHSALPADSGDVHVGIFNGENYNHSEVNGRKALEVRGSIRPLVRLGRPWRGVRLHAFYDADSYVRSGERRRADVSATVEHPRVNAGAEYLATADRPTISTTAVSAHGYSMWVTPRLGHGWEALLRYDHLTPDLTLDRQTRSRTIAGVAYWFPQQRSVSTALLLDYDGQRVNGAATPIPPKEQIALHALLTF